MTDQTHSTTQPPNGAIPVESLYNGLRGQLLKDEHVLWQGKGSGRALDAFNPALALRFGLLAIGAALLVFLLLDNRNPSYNGVAWVLVILLVARVGWFVWRSSATPANTAESATNSAPQASATRRASVVFPQPGGPHKIIEYGRPAASARDNTLPGPQTCACPSTSANTRGRMRSAKGAKLFTAVKKLRFCGAIFPAVPNCYANAGHQRARAMRCLDPGHA